MKITAVSLLKGKKVSIHERVFTLLAESCEETIQASLGELEVNFNSFDLNFIQVLLRLCSNSKVMRDWLRTSGYLNLIFEKLRENSFETVKDEMESKLLELLLACMNRNPNNQSCIAEILVREYQPKVHAQKWLDTFLSKLFLECSRFENRVNIFVWNLDWQIECLANGPDYTGRLNPYHVLGQNTSFLQGMTTKVPFRLNPLACGKTIDITNNYLTATQVVFEKWGVVRADYELPLFGVSSWEVRLDNCPKGHIFLGVATSRSNIDGYLGCDRHGWGFIGNRGVWHNKHKENTYGKEFRTGDIVKVILDMNEGTLSFALNGEELGVAFTGLSGLKLYPAFSLYQKGDRFTLLHCLLPRSDSASHNGVSQASNDSMNSLPISNDKGLLNFEDREDSYHWRFGEQDYRYKHLRSYPVFVVRADMLAKNVFDLIGKGSLLNELRRKYHREETNRFLQTNQYSWNVDLINVSSLELNQNPNTTTLTMLIENASEDYLEVELHVG